MHEPKLRIFVDSTPATPPAAPGKAKVRVALSEIAEILVDAIESDRAWLRDFATEEVELSADLHEILVAYQYFHRSAG